MVVRDWREQRRTTAYRRILLGLSCSDLVSSVMLGFQSFLMPPGRRVYAMGNDASRTVLGFFQQFAFTNLWYSGMLRFFFLLTV